ncbi:MAG TPA: hypothetical protein VMB79_14240 [Jatrophihabitans sp.]|nr:hypothetical protein [Jatrophihabitans sp.]
MKTADVRQPALVDSPPLGDVELLDDGVGGESRPAGAAQPDVVGHHEAPEPPAVARRDVRRMLGALFIAAGLAHLLHRRLYRSLVPDWLWPVRREIDATTAAAEIAGGVLLFVPKLYRLARWLNLAVLAPAMPAALWEWRRPFVARVLRDPIWPGPRPVGPLGRAPGHAGVAALLWWATERD